MIKLTNKQIADFYFRSYISADGLWFLKVEEELGFEEALKIDKQVWSVLPKIQARLLKSFADKRPEASTLIDCFSTKLKLEGYSFTTENSKNGFKVTINRCPWHDQMVKSGRKKLSGKIGDVICVMEYKSFASEFGDKWQIVFDDRICKGECSCIVKFDLKRSPL